MAYMGAAIRYMPYHGLHLYERQWINTALEPQMLSGDILDVPQCTPC